MDQCLLWTPDLNEIRFEFPLGRCWRGTTPVVQGSGMMEKADWLMLRTPIKINALLRALECHIACVFFWPCVSVVLKYVLGPLPFRFFFFHFDKVHTICVWSSVVISCFDAPFKKCCGYPKCWFCDRYVMFSFIVRLIDCTKWILRGFFFFSKREILWIVVVLAVLCFFF